jgi:hypothetical protein
MRSARLTILIIVAPMLALGAGVAGGVLVSRIPGHDPGSSSVEASESSLTAILGLTSDQREQMRQIWEAARSKVHQTVEQAQNLQKERDDALFALLDAEGKVKFASISREFADRDQNLTRQRDAAFADAVGRTKALLNPAQREKYDQILRTHVRADSATPGVSQDSATMR